MEYENKDEDIVYQYIINILERSFVKGDDRKTLENAKNAYEY